MKYSENILHCKVELLTLLLADFMMKKRNGLKSQLCRGEVYRREDLARYSSAIDRDLAMLVQEGELVKLRGGLYHYPKLSVFGKLPPDEKKLIRKFLKDDNFLITSPNQYNGLGVGTTQLYNKAIVYNHKRKGAVRLGNREFHFVDKAAFPRKATVEYLMVDLVNNLNQLAEDADQVLDKVRNRAAGMDHAKFKKTVERYGSAKTKRLLGTV